MLGKTKRGIVKINFKYLEYVSVIVPESRVIDLSVDLLKEAKLYYTVHVYIILVIYLHT